MEMEPTNQPLRWWGYRHVDGTVQAKRYNPQYRSDVDEAFFSDFVAQVVEPFEAKDRDEALNHVREATTDRQDPAMEVALRVLAWVIVVIGIALHF